MPGRGQYYKNKYDGGGRGRGSIRADAQPDVSEAGLNGEVNDWAHLQAVLGRINGQQYGAYNQLHGQYLHTNPDFVLCVDKVQADPFAPPSRIRVIIGWQTTGIPDEYLAADIRKIAVCDFLTRTAIEVIRGNHLNHNIGNGNGNWSAPKGGAFNINAAGQEVLPRSSAVINASGTIELRFTVSLPAAGRRILGPEAWRILGQNLIPLVQNSLLYEHLDQTRLREHVLSVERQHCLRLQLTSHGLIAFVANGSILPRSSGAASTPMELSQAVPFQSPKEAEVTLHYPDGVEVHGMGIPRGITLLTGGGFHGKSTLLEALELGIYNHIPGDGRTGVVTDPTAVKIRAEDGRNVMGVDISPFISNLPGGRNTTQFSSDDASGSTSMAANVQEALEAKCKVLLIDEDSSATNLLVRDQRMHMVVQREPITPLISKTRALFQGHGVSTVIVVGGLGDWLSIADNVILMDSYIPRSAKAEAMKAVKQFPTNIPQDESYGTIPMRKLQLSFKDTRGPYAKRKTFISVRPAQKDPIDDPAEGEPGIDISGLDQIVEIGQSRRIATLLEEVARETGLTVLSMDTILQRLERNIGIDKPFPVSSLGGAEVAVRRFELAAALSRMRGLHVVK